MLRGTARIRTYLGLANYMHMVEMEFRRKVPATLSLDLDCLRPATRPIVSIVQQLSMWGSEVEFGFANVEKVVVCHRVFDWRPRSVWS
jgi:arginase family enzyme